MPAKLTIYSCDEDKQGGVVVVQGYSCLVYFISGARLF